MNTWYLRLYEPHQPENNKGYSEAILPSYEVFKKIKGHDKIDVVELETGVVHRHDYKKPLPNWLSDPLIRAMVIANGRIPTHEK